MSSLSLFSYNLKTNYLFKANLNLMQCRRAVTIDVTLMQISHWLYFLSASVSIMLVMQQKQVLPNNHEVIV